MFSNLFPAERVYKWHTVGRRAVADQLDPEQTRQRADLAVGRPRPRAPLTNIQIRSYRNLAYLPLQTSTAKKSVTGKGVHFTKMTIVQRVFGLTWFLCLASVSVEVSAPLRRPLVSSPTYYSEFVLSSLHLFEWDRNTEFCLMSGILHSDIYNRVFESEVLIAIRVFTLYHLYCKGIELNGRRWSKVSKNVALPRIKSLLYVSC